MLGEAILESFQTLRLERSGREAHDLASINSRLLREPEAHVEEFLK